MNQSLLYSWLCLVISLASAARAEERTLFSFDRTAAAKAWRVVNDGVMGGRSRGRFTINDEHNLEFTGTLSLENNGGFASIRASGDKLGLKRGESVFIRVRGDGREYRFNLYTRSDLGGYSYRQSFETRKGEWVEVELPIDRFVATWRGRVFPNEEFDASEVRGMGILLGDKKAGPFRLEVAWIKTGVSQ